MKSAAEKREEDARRLAELEAKQAEGRPHHPRAENQGRGRPRGSQGQQRKRPAEKAEARQKGRQEAKAQAARAERARPGARPRPAQPPRGRARRTTRIYRGQVAALKCPLSNLGVISEEAVTFRHAGNQSGPFGYVQLRRPGNP